MSHSPIINAMSDIIRQTWGDKTLKGGDIELLHILLNLAIEQQNTDDARQNSVFEDTIEHTCAEWAVNRIERLYKWQVAKDNNLFGSQLDPNGLLTDKQEETVDKFLLFHPSIVN